MSESNLRKDIQKLKSDTSNNSDKIAVLNGSGAVVEKVNKSVYDAFVTGVNSDLSNIPQQTYITEKAKQSDINNILKAISTTDEESVDNFDMADKTALLNAKRNKTINITFWGDSIVTKGNYVDKETGMFTKVYEAQLKKAFVDCTFNIKNLGIGGLSIVEAMSDTYMSSWFENEPTLGDGTKTWKAYVKDTAPDLLFVAFGMNSTQDCYSLYSTTQALLTYVKTWAKVPTIIFIPNYLPRVGYLSTIEYNKRLEAMRVTREFCKLNNIICFDVGNKYNKLVKGTDYKSQVTAGYLQDVVDTSNQLVANGIITYATPSTSKINVDNMLDFTINTTVNFKTTDALYQILFRKGLMLFIKASGVIEIYLDTFKSATVTTTAFTLNTGYIIKVSVTGTRLIITINDVVILSSDSYLSLLSDTVYIGCRIGQLSLSNITVQKFVDKNFYPMLTEADMLGVYVAGNYDTKYPTGGNGVNHPSQLAVMTLYKPFIDDFINKLQIKLTNQKSISPILVSPSSWVASGAWQGVVADSGLNIYYSIVPTKKYDTQKTMYLVNMANNDIYTLNPTIFNSGEGYAKKIGIKEIALIANTADTDILYITASSLPSFNSFLYFIH